MGKPLFLIAALLSGAMPAAASAQPAAPLAPAATAAFAALDADFAGWASENHIPGMVWGVVKDGRLIHVGTYGRQAAAADAPAVTVDTGFRIASMSKAFTAYAILRLRDAGKLRLDDPVWRYVPAVRRWGPRLTVADLLHHTTGMVTDDPWGDRQQVLSEADFTAMLTRGVPFTAEPGTRYEYSNFGYALLGRVITAVSGQEYAAYIARTVFAPLGMRATTYEIGAVPLASRAIGYRWEDNAWREEPTMRHGAFGAMGGITTTANDYARWLGFLLAAWPAESGGEGAATVRAMQYGGGLPQARPRPGKDAQMCRVATVYGAGLIAGNDCLLGQVLFHGGGFPGYGSHVLLIPDAGAAVFAFANRTYAGPSGPVWDAATTLWRAGILAPRALPVSPDLARGYAAARAIWAAGGLDGAPAGALAMNVTMDRDAAHWASLLAARKQESGPCDAAPTPVATGRLSGTFRWTCQNGTIEGDVLLAPVPGAPIQALSFRFVPRP